MSNYPDEALASTRAHTAELIEEGREELAQQTPRKMTAARLQRVEQLQNQLIGAAALAADLSEEELGAWVPGTPQSSKTPRSEPLRALSSQLTSAVEELERLYA